MKREDLRKEFTDNTGYGAEIPDFEGEPRTFTESYVKYLEDKILSALRDEKEEKPAKSGRDILTEINAHLTHYWQDERYVRWKDAIKAMEQYATQFQSSSLPPQPGRGAEERPAESFTDKELKVYNWLRENYMFPMTMRSISEIITRITEIYHTQSEGKDMYPKEDMPQYFIERPRIMDFGIWFKSDFSGWTNNPEEAMMSTNQNEMFRRLESLQKGRLIFDKCEITEHLFMSEPPKSLVK